MYAVIETGGKQYRVEVGTELEVELLDGAAGDSIAFDRILLVADGDAASIGRPVVANASVSAEVVRRDRGEKLISFKYRPKARRRVKKGHRQELTVIRISDIVLDGKSAASDLAAVEAKKQTERQRLQEAARKQAEQDAALAAKLAADAKAADAAAKPEAPAKPKAASSAAKSKAGKAAPSTTAAKPAAKTTKPAAKTAKPAAKTTKPAAESDTAEAGAATGKAKTEARKAPRARKSE